MELLWKRWAGEARQASTKVSNWQMPVILSALVFLIPCKNADGQSLEQKKGQSNTDTVKRVDLTIQSLDDFRIALLHRNDPPLSGRSQKDSEKPHAGMRPFFSQYKTKNDQFFLDMNRKLDSAWQKFDQRCRARDKLSTRSILRKSSIGLNY